VGRQGRPGEQAEEEYSDDESVASSLLWHAATSWVCDDLNIEHSPFNIAH
jgi:hypothetical protein